MKARFERTRTLVATLALGASMVLPSAAGAAPPGPARDPVAPSAPQTQRVEAMRPLERELQLLDAPLRAVGFGLAAALYVPALVLNPLLDGLEKAIGRIEC